MSILQLFLIFIPRPIKNMVRNFRNHRRYLDISVRENFDISVRENLDFLILDLPPRYIPMIPNGLGHVYNILQQTAYHFQIIDVSIILFHRYHRDRINNNFDLSEHLNGNKIDPWDNTNVGDWHREDFLDLFWPYMKPIVESVIKARPKLLGISLNGSNRILAKRLVREVRERLPELKVVVGGYDCVYPNIGPHLFKESDYMVVGEAECSLIPFLDCVLQNKSTQGLPGIISKENPYSPSWVPAKLPEDLDALLYPRYEWTKLSHYFNYNGVKMLMPITSSRGCKWGRCRFCCERFAFRCRSPESVVEEIQFLVDHGFNDFHFNESDVNGDPQNLYQICSEIIRRGLQVNLTGQLRINIHNTAEYMQHLYKAGFLHLRFGVDGWSEHLLYLQRKGYNIPLVIENLKNCHNAKIYTTVNIVIGVPGELDQDVEETIINIIKCKDYIDLVESINTLILSGGSEYYQKPDEYGIKFRIPYEEIKTQHPYFVPPELWWSKFPLIDQSIRLARLEHICTVLHRNGINIGGFAQKAIEGIKKGEAGGGYEK